jgi:hypothetical protein
MVSDPDRHEADPLRPLLEVGAGLPAGWAVCVQVLARPAAPRRAAGLRHAAWTLRNRAATGSGPLPRSLSTAINTTLDLLTPAPAAAAGRSPGSSGRGALVDPFLAEDVRSVRDKTAHPMWEAAVRYAATAPTRPQARGLADAVATAFAVYAGRNQLARHRLHHPARVLAARRLGRGFLASVPELAALAHLPFDADAPGVERAGARAVPPHPRIPTAGRWGVKVVGDADAGAHRPVAVSVADARHHLHVIGATGCGKSTLLAHLILQDVAAGRGVIVVDPKGDLVTDLLHLLPAAAADRVVLFDPDDAALTPPRLNVLAGPNPDLIADHVVGVFARIYHAWWGPRTEDVLRAAVLTLTHPANQARGEASHLGAIPRLLGEEAFRRRATAPIHTDPRDRILAGFWTWYESLSEAARAQVTGPVLNKLRAFLLRSFVRATLTGGTPAIDMRAVLDGGICLARLPKGTLGEDTTRLLGSILLARAWQTATARTGQAARCDAAVYLDEAHNFLTLPHAMEDMLAEARSLRLCLVLAHQNLAQLPRDLREGISANARNKVFFQVSPEDAAALERHVAPQLCAHDLAHLDGYHAAARLLAGSRPAPACTLRARPLPQPVAGRAAAIRRAARTRQHPRGRAA